MKKWLWIPLALSIGVGLNTVVRAQWILDGVTWPPPSEPIQPEPPDDPPSEPSPSALVVNLAGPILHEPGGMALHFEVQWSTNHDFSDAVTYSSADDTAGWFSFNGTTYQPMPEGGFKTAFYFVHEGLGSVVFVSQDLLDTNVFVRARSYNGVDWSDYRTAYGSGTVTLNASGAVPGVRAVAQQQTANADNAGTIRYREDGNGSYVEMSMRVGPSAYAWVEIISNPW